MNLEKIIKKPLTITILILLIGHFSLTLLIKELDKTINEHVGNGNTEIMLWQPSPGYQKEPQLNFYEFEIYPSKETIKVIYKIKNTSDKPISIQDSIDIALVAADANSIGDPGTTVWRWSDALGEPKVERVDLGPRELFKEEISIKRKQVEIGSQYYINAYYKGEFVSQYKIIEGIYK